MIRKGQTVRVVQLVRTPAENGVVRDYRPGTSLEATSDERDGFVKCVDGRGVRVLVPVVAVRSVAVGEAV